MTKPDRHTIIPAVWMIVRNSQNEILLLRRYNTGWRDGQYTVPAGHVEAGESPSAAAVRELKEEANISVESARLSDPIVCYYPSDDDSDHERISFFYLLDNYDGPASNAEPEKADELIWCPESELPPQTVPLLKVVLEQLLHQPQHFIELNYPDSQFQFDTK